jgi:DNA-binding HxlR family transcriptional regulator
MNKKTDFSSDNSTTSLNFELIDKINNKNRKIILIELYKNPLHYHEIMSLTNLKPGSIYHHLKILEPLVQKFDQGIYEITELGRNIIEQLELIPIDFQKPNMKISRISNISQTKKVDEGYLKRSDVGSELGDYFFIGKYSYLIFLYVVFISLSLINYDIVIAGSAIYKVPPGTAVYFIIIAFFSGWITIFMLEDVFRNLPKFVIVKNTLLVRLISMFPPSIIGTSLLVLYINGYTLFATAQIIIFILSILVSLLLSSKAHSFLNGTDIRIALQVCGFMVIIDLLIGVVVIVLMS